MKQSAVLFFLVMLAVAHAFGDERAQRVLGFLDLDRPELGAVRALAEQDRPGEAMERLLHHFRTREMDYHFDAESQIRDLPGIDFDIESLMVVPSVRGMPVGVHDTTTPEEALQRRLTFLHTTVDFRGGVDWRHQESDREWNFMLNRHTYFLTLTEAYRRTEDERYIAELAERLREWDEQVEPGFPRRLEVGIRLRHWVWLFPVAVRSERFDADLLAVFLDNLHGMAEALNARGEEGYPSSNQGAMQAVAVLHAVAYFPEFRNAPVWGRDTAARMAGHIFESTREDGVYRGRSPGYHNVTLREMNWFYQLLNRAGREVPEEFEKRFHAMIDHAVAFTKPDLTIPQFGHTDRDFMEDRLSQWGRQADRPDALWLAAKGAEGSPPEWTDRIFPHGEFSLLRSAWEDGRDARWLMFDHGPRGRGADRCLAVELYAYGRSLVAAPGRYGYTRDGRALFERTRFQNTVSIDEQSQTRNPNRELVRKKLDGNLKLLHGWHDGYSHLLEGEGEIVHERQVLMIRDRFWVVADLVRVEGEKEFTFDQNWRFLPTELRPLHGYPNAFLTGYDDANLAIVPLGGEAVAHQEDSWFSPRYGVKHPAPRLAYRQRASDDWFLVTLLAPYPGEALPLTGISSSTDGNGVQVRLSWNDGFLDEISLRFGSDRGSGEVHWKGLRNGRAIGEETIK